MASGNLGLISFPREPGRVTLERLEQLHPRLVPALRDHPGIAFVMVRSERDGTLAIGRDGVHHLDTGRVEGEDPLAPFGPTAARHLRRTNGFPHCPDVVIDSTFWDEPARWPPSRSWWARTAAWGARSHTRSCCTWPSCPGRTRRWWEPSTCTAS